MLTASVVTYHTPDRELKDCLHALQQSCTDQIIIIDNASEERIRGIASLFSKVKYIPSGNIGYGSAHNKGIRHAIESGADFHLVLNTDTCFTPEDISELLDRIKEANDIGIVHPRITDCSGNDLFTSRMLPTPADLFIRRFLPKRMFRHRRDRYLLKNLDRNNSHNIPYHQGSFLLFRVSALKDCGLFDERFFMYPEDIDLCRRIHRKYRTLYVPAPTVVHHHRAASYKSLRMLIIHIANMIRYFNKWGWWNDSERKAMNAPLQNH